MIDSNGPALVILAAGIGSRYKGFKQLDVFGFENETIMELSIKDAIDAGFKRIVLVINKQIVDQIKRNLIEKYKPTIDIDYVFQELTDLPSPYHLPAGRTKPWGTGHAVLAANNAVDTPFAVINADDYYGSSAFGQIRSALSEVSADSNQFFAVGYLLYNTLSKHGGVSRGLCQQSNSYLSSVKEITNISLVNGKIIGTREQESIDLSQDSIVSMNFWGFTPKVFDILEDQFKQFLEINLEKEGSEFFLPDALSRSIEKGESTVKVLTTNEKWFGVTFREDRDEVRKGIQDYLKNR